MFELTEQDYREIAERQAQRRGEAWDWLSLRFADVHEEEISDDIARDIRIIQDWEQGCAECVDIRTCKHSRAVLTISEEGERGFRVFRTRAKVCEPCLASMEAAAIAAQQKTRRTRHEQRF